MAKRRKLEGKRPRPGQPPFVPTDEQRNTVGVMAAIGIPQERMRLLVINPRTKKPIEIPTLKRAFAWELEAGRAQTDLDFAIAIAAGIRAGDYQKLALYARNRLGWDRRQSATLELPTREGDTSEPQDNRMEIVLVRACPQLDESGE